MSSGCTHSEDAGVKCEGTFSMECIFIIVESLHSIAAPFLLLQLHVLMDS